MKNIIRFVLSDILKNKIVLAYTLLLAAFSWSTFSLEDSSAKGLLTLLNLILLIVPLVSILFSTIYLYNSAEFIELLVSHPLTRIKIWLSLYAGLALSLVAAFLFGGAIPLLIYAPVYKAMMMIGVGCLVTLIFVSIAFLCAIVTRDKAKGIGISILLWLYFALFFDGLVLFLLFQFGDYPIEKFMIGVSALSPINLSRILILLELDASAMMGYTGAIFKKFFGTQGGLLLSFVILLVWAIFPLLLSLRKFNKKDL